MTGESNSAVPSSRMSTGTLPSGFCLRTGSPGSWVEADSILTRWSSPSRLTAMRGLRPNGELKLVRSVGMRVAPSCRYLERAPVAGPCQQIGKRRAENSAGDHEVYGFRALAFFVGLYIERDPLPFHQGLQSGAFDRSDMNEDIAPAVIGLDESVAALAVEEFDRTCHCHRDAPDPPFPPPPPTARRLAGHSQSGKAS